jgi:predicted kinase
MARIHLIEGPIGAGKSTFAASLSQRIGAPHINLDDWMTTLFRADRPASEVMPWYSERKERCIEQIWKLTCSLLACKVDTILELGLIRRALREDFYRRVDNAGYPLSVYVLDAPREVRHQRVRERNRARAATFFMEVPDAIFELASDMWEPPHDEEIGFRNIQLIETAVARGQ